MASGGGGAWYCSRPPPVNCQGELLLEVCCGPGPTIDQYVPPTAFNTLRRYEPPRVSGGCDSWEEEVMKTKKTAKSYSPEVKERVVRIVLNWREVDATSTSSRYPQIGAQSSGLILLCSVSLNILSLLNAIAHQVS